MSYIRMKLDFAVIKIHHPQESTAKCLTRAKRQA
jgi:hypothetical protein